MASEPGPAAEREQVAHHVDVALRSMGQPNAVASQFDFWDDFPAGVPGGSAAAGG